MSRVNCRARFGGAKIGHASNGEARGRIEHRRHRLSGPPAIDQALLTE
jgi:hypothetical protein